MDELKNCNKCAKISSKTDFYKNKNTRDGHLNDCKECLKEYTIRNKEKIKNYKKQFFQENKDKNNEYNRKI